MKEKKLSYKRIINKLLKQNYVEICPICDECIMDLIPFVLDYCANVNINITAVEDRLYCVKLSIA